MSNVSTASLQSPNDWADLHTAIDQNNSNQALSGLLNTLKMLGANSCLIEEEYLDQDFTELYSQFYSKVFKRHTKICRRFHFFSFDIRSLFSSTKSGDVLAGLKSDEAQNSYLGFMVVRPVKHAPIGRAVVALPDAPVGYRSELLVTSRHEVHICGVAFFVNGTALTQQDSRVGSCAQATIWMAGRHFHNKYKGPWISTAAITEAATTLTEVSISMMLPTGSEALAPNNILQAFRAIERQPFIYVCDDLDKNTKKPVWNKLRPVDAIHRYVDSGIPVMLGLGNVTSIGHAVLATGVVYEGNNLPTKLPIHPTKAELSEYFLINDDQRGANLWIPLNANSNAYNYPFNVEDHLIYMIIPLPRKVFISAEQAEEIAWGLLRPYENSYPTNIKPLLAGSDTTTGDYFHDGLVSNNIVARTYLTFGWKYKNRMLNNSIHNDFKSELIFHEMPKYVWVTEFSHIDGISDLNTNKHLVLAHIVVDATASRHWETASIFHAPGIMVKWSHDPANQFGNMLQHWWTLQNDTPYLPKFRGT